ncbi:MAG TPA: DUF748 domain-containing protein [Polyangia bacterium]|jgi:hypothetical protein|nr:DUF748 domain-containing protein [Polyangia bacterium]
MKPPHFDRGAAPRPHARPVLVALAFGMAAGAGSSCRHPPPATPQSLARERARLQRLPGDARTLDARWDRIDVGAGASGAEARAAAAVDGLKIRMFNREGPSTTLRLPVSSAELRKLFPVDIDRVSVRNGELDYVDVSQPGRPELWIHDIELALENLTTRPSLSGGLPVLLTARATVQRSGTLLLFVTADPWGKGVNAAGRASLRGLRAAELYGFLRVAAGLEAPQGTIDVFVEFQIRQNQIIGGIKPLLRNIEVRPVGTSLWDRLKATLVDIGMDVVSDRVPGRDAVAGIVPIQGSLNDTQAELWPAVVSVLRNAFVQGIAAGFSRLPPPSGERTR